MGTSAMLPRDNQQVKGKSVGLETVAVVGLVDVQCWPAPRLSVSVSTSHSYAQSGTQDIMQFGV
jgi:hypothetical protein